MDPLLETVSVILSLVALFLVPFVLFVIYLIKRNGFYVNANCWFCNSWTKVLYADRNSFYCPTCLQYNGFDENGDYNKLIEEQYDISTNKYNKTLQKTAPVTNGLCTYCNNNRQLKIFQLANFVPLNEKNYDVEIEHFEKQLEKAYKLCKRCDNVLRTTLEKQHAWIFGNRLQSLQKKSKIIQKGKRTKRVLCLSIIKYILVLFCTIIICQPLDIQVYWTNSKFNTYMPNIFIPYTIFFNDISNIVTNASISVNDGLNELNSYLPNYIKFRYNNLLPLSCMGLILQAILVIWDQQFIWWKINQILGWILLFSTSLISFDKNYLDIIKLLQAICSSTIMCSLLLPNKTVKLKTTSTKKKFEFKKFTKCVESTDYSDIEEEEDSHSSVFSKRSNSFRCNGDLNGSACDCRSTSARPQSVLFQNKRQNTANDSFTTARSTKTASILNNSFKANSDLSSSELNRSLDNLHLSNLKPHTCTTPVFSINSVNRPILSPPKLKNVTQNSWTAGGFWKNDVTLFPGTTEFTNLSRSSSQTSGFVSNDPVNLQPFSSLPPSRESSVYGDFERTSILSEPAYHFQPISSNGSSSYRLKNNLVNHVAQSPKLSLSPDSNKLYYKANNNMFYPVLNQNNMLFIQAGDGSRNVESSFGNLSLKNFNMGVNGVQTPPLFGKQPVVSSLFKNLPGISTQSYSFKTPHC